MPDRALYLPADWTADDERRDAAGVPEEITFATRPQQAGRMVATSIQDGVKARWFAADEVYGRLELRRHSENSGSADTTTTTGTTTAVAAQRVTDVALPRSHKAQITPGKDTTRVPIVLGKDGGHAACSVAVRGEHRQRSTALGSFGRASCSARAIEQPSR